MALTAHKIEETPRKDDFREPTASKVEEMWAAEHGLDVNKLRFVRWLVETGRLSDYPAGARRG